MERLKGRVDCRYVIMSSLADTPITNNVQVEVVVCTYVWSSGPERS